MTSTHFIQPATSAINGRIKRRRATSLNVTNAAAR